jgi:uncharacterized 2Fe-2S/4Fe-4S cluster protein (DUF4445 family)
MKTIKIVSQKNEKLVRIKRGYSLLDILQENGYNIYTPCGGKGTCGKCRVRVKGKGLVIACTYFPAYDMEIILPDEREAQILVAQSEYLEEFPLNIAEIKQLSNNPHGVAIDIGTTSIVFYHVDLISGKVLKINSILNPQAAYGSDIISRINYCQTKKDGLHKLQKAILQAINNELIYYKKNAGIKKTDIVKLLIVGNNTMLHILLGEDPVPIAMAPFTPKFTHEQIVKGESLGLNTHPEAEIRTLPSISAYVGADIVSGIAVLKQDSKKRNILYVDIGTNGEIVLITPDRILTCATAAGPAFEGANISCGMGAVEGAISMVTKNGELYTIGNAKPVGICGSGIIDVVSYLLDNGLMNVNGLLKEPYTIINDTPNGKIEILQKDIREIQLAKSAIFSGIKVLLKKAGLTFNDINALYLAGGFGNYINIESAVNIGLLPGEVKDKTVAIGNSAGAGALQALRSIDFHKRINTILSISEYIELSNSDDFNIEYTLNMNF